MQRYLVGRRALVIWLLHDIAITNIVWHACNRGWSGGNTALRNRVGDEGGEWGAQTKRVFVKNIIDPRAKASN